MAKTNTTVRLGPDEHAALERIRRVAPALGTMPLSRLLRLVLMSADQALDEGEQAGARDRADRRTPRARRKARTVVDFFELGYEVGYGEKVARGYRTGKADGENARRSGLVRNVEPLTLDSSEYEVGYVDGLLGGFVEGFAAGDADRRSDRPYCLPTEDPVVFSHYARGYRAGRLAGEEEYDRGVAEGRLSFERGEAYPPLEPDDRVSVGRRDGYFGFARAGLLEGEADSDNDRYRVPDGVAAFTAYALGYRTAGRPLAGGRDTAGERVPGVVFGARQRVSGQTERLGERGTAERHDLVRGGLPLRLRRGSRGLHAGRGSKGRHEPFGRRWAVRGE